tara:strand:+ start:69 stop:635 length:567 start_codon:yes stop_codon:yes gene_type:complete
MVYNYAKNVSSPRTIGVTGEGSLKAMTDSMGAMSKYAGFITVGPKVGDKYLIDVGKCNEDSVEECKFKRKNIIVNNIPEGMLKISTPFGAAEFKGFIPSIGEDMIGLINPSDWVKRASNKCIMREDTVGSADVVRGKSVSNLKSVKFCGPDMSGGGNKERKENVTSICLVVSLFLLLVVRFFSNYKTE